MPAPNQLPARRPVRRGRGAGNGGDGIDVLQLAIILMMAVSVWRLQNLFPILDAIKIQYIAPAFAILAYLGDNDPRRSLSRAFNPLAHKLLGIMGFVALSVPTSLWPGKSMDFMLDDHAKTILLMVLLAASVRSFDDVKRYAIVHVAGAVVYSQQILTRFRVSVSSGRLGELIYYDSNDLGLLLVCTIPLCVFFLRPGANAIVRLAATAILGLLAYTLVQTGSRGAFLGLIGCGAYLLFNFGAISKMTRIYSVGALVAFMMLFGGPKYWEMMSSLLSPKEDYNWTSDAGRKAVWTRGLGYMVSHPINGVGARAFGQAEGTISNLAVRQQYGIGLKWSAAHNSFIEVGAELGLIALALFLGALWQSWRFVRTLGGGGSGGGGGGGPGATVAVFGQALGGVVIAYCVAGFFVSAGYSAFMYTIFGMIIGLMKLSGPATNGRPAPKGRGVLRRRPSPVRQGAQPAPAAVARTPLIAGPGGHPGVRG